MTERHEKWVRVEPGTVIPAGQPYRVEYGSAGGNQAHEFPGHRNDHRATDAPLSNEDVTFVDSSWKPPLVLPAARSLILAEIDDHYTEDKVLLTGPHKDKGNTWWSFDTRLTLIPNEINSFEILWTEGDR